MPYPVYEMQEKAWFSENFFEYYKMKVKYTLACTMISS